MQKRMRINWPVYIFLPLKLDRNILPLITHRKSEKVLHLHHEKSPSLNCLIMPLVSITCAELPELNWQRSWDFNDDIKWTVHLYSLVWKEPLSAGCWFDAELRLINENVKKWKIPFMLDNEKRITEALNSSFFQTIKLLWGDVGRGREKTAPSEGSSHRMMKISRVFFYI